MNININDKEITLKYSLRAMMMYENVTNKTLNPSGITEVVTFFYCVVLASSKDYSLSFEDFMDWLDENPDTLKEFGFNLTSNKSKDNSYWITTEKKIINN